jgi:hypothetical protein
LSLDKITIAYAIVIAKGHGKRMSLILILPPSERITASSETG